MLSSSNGIFRADFQKMRRFLNEIIYFNFGIVKICNYAKKKLGNNTNLISPSEFKSFGPIDQYNSNYSRERIIIIYESLPSRDLIINKGGLIKAQLCAIINLCSGYIVMDLSDLSSSSIKMQDGIDYKINIGNRIGLSRGSEFYIEKIESKEINIISQKDGNKDMQIVIKHFLTIMYEEITSFDDNNVIKAIQFAKFSLKENSNISFDPEIIIFKLNRNDCNFMTLKSIEKHNHAEIRYNKTTQEFYIRDVGSKNGTFLIVKKPIKSTRFSQLVEEDRHDYLPVFCSLDNLCKSRSILNISDEINTDQELYFHKLVIDYEKL